ncbi:RNA-binding RNA processing protein NOP9 [Aspergillus aculeatinus CBS 121060]|uniref:rRNA processing protein Nop9 n=1 Tax=Aspergillus aculeatinus CBS 121060 TaxID=1448322 RepID=A0ACD1HD61_9EURO|nr:rRNA processing protein Nop9 [Aspergillus aculeatinus CBS 121060]RAH71464.1 rRNA processing protein Nop9 [Aspergillus aculeatinus CBS 121060]
MPRENQKRGRRAADKASKDAAKRKRDEVPEETLPKRMKPSTDDEPANDDFTQGADYIALDAEPAYDQQAEQEGFDQENGDSGETVFFGLLDPEEQEYFSRASEVLELNQFGDEEERRVFIESVYTEARGKELKIACSQSCSRLMEKLISLSDMRQIRRLFNKFIGHFLHLVQHRFASHCCETLFINAAPGVTQKPSKPKAEKMEVDGEEDEEPEPELSLAEMFMTVVEELQGNWGYLLTERFASHTIRVLLLVLAGEPVDLSLSDSVVASRKKERLGLANTDTPKENPVAQKRGVPETFEATLKKVMKDMVSVLDDTYLRALATHPVGNPVLQVLVYLELSHFGKSSAKDPKSITRRLIPDEEFTEGSESTIFVRGLLYDPVGSRLLETIVKCLPGKLFKALYKNLMREQMGSLARNITAGYVVLRILERLGKDDLKEAVDLIVPQISGLIERSRLIVPKALIERCLIRGVDTGPIARALEAAYDRDPARRLDKMLWLEGFSQDDVEQPRYGEEGTSAPNNQKALAAARLHSSLFAQTMLTAPGALSGLVYSGLLAQSTESLIKIATDPTASHVLQQALTLPTSTTQFRRQLVTRFTGQLKDLALDSSGSRVVDALWHATKDVFFVKERMAQELAQNEMALRDSFVGRAVWRNWSMDLYKRRRGEWAAKAKGLDAVNSTGERPKSRIELARAKFAAKAEENAQKASATSS